LERARQLPYYDARADKTARTNYYRGLSRRRSGRAFFTALSDLVTRTHEHVLPYEPAQHVYPWIDLRPNSMLRSIYTGDEYEPEELIRADIEVRESLTARLRERFGAESAIPRETLALLEAELPYNCEHVVPQSWFAERQPMRGDLHHLFACESTCNSFRGRKSYFEFADFEEVIRDGCGKRVENQFEPNHGKGEAARATLYFLLRYPGQINRRSDEYEEDRLAMLLEWHRQEPVSDYERHRNAAIFAKQGNRNPLIDFPAWADRIDFTPGLGTP
jgi:endonuclease I